MKKPVALVPAVEALAVKNPVALAPAVTTVLGARALGMVAVKVQNPLR